ncbi:MAG: hypothetical protein ACKPCQ_17925, partial [Dolichospermum sp.]
MRKLNPLSNDCCALYSDSIFSLLSSLSNKTKKFKDKEFWEHTALSGVMRYTTGGQDAHPTRVLLLKFVPHSNGICCN